MPTSRAPFPATRSVSGKPLATRITCVAAVALFLLAWPIHRGAVPLAAELLVVGLLPALGVYLDWLRLERPSTDDAFFAAAALGGALVVGLAPGPVTALWHPVLLGVGLTFAFRRRVVSGRIAHVEPAALVLDLGHGRLSIDRDAHDELGVGSSLELTEGATLALITGLGRRTDGAGPFRSATVLTHGAILDAAQGAQALHARRRRHALLAVALVVLSATVGWAAALADLTISLPCRA